MIDMTRTISGRIYVKGKSAFSSQREDKNEEENSAKKTLNEAKTTVEVSTPDKVKHVGKSQFNFPDLTPKPQGGTSNQDKNALQALLCIRSFDSSPQLSHMPKWHEPNSSLPASSLGSRSSRTTKEQIIDKGAVYNKCDQTDHKVNLKHNILPLLPVSTVLNGQRVTVRSPESSKNTTEVNEQVNRGTIEKEQLSNGDCIKTKNNALPLLSLSTAPRGECVLSQRKQALNEQGHEEKTAKDIKASQDKDKGIIIEKEQLSFKDSIKAKNGALPFLSLSAALKGQCELSQRKQGLQEQGHEEKTANATPSQELNECKKRKTSTQKRKHQTTINKASAKTGKQGTRTVFHLPKADKYDITPDGKYTGRKVCRVIKVEDLKASLTDSCCRDSWVPSVDKQVMVCSVFKAIMQQPIVFLRQPSPVKGVQMSLLDQEVSLAAAIQAVQETNEPSPVPAVAELTKELKHFVIKLPPIC